jgi:hypothetical protein
MDELDPIRELVVEAMAELEQALVDGLSAQAPRSGTQGIKLGLAALKRRIEVASRKVEEAERRLSDVS